MRIQILIIPIPKPICSYQPPRFGITNILQLSPPFTEADSPEIANGPCQGHDVAITTLYIPLSTFGISIEHTERPFDDLSKRSRSVYHP